MFLETIFHINVSRALIGQPNPAEELAMLEAKAAQTWGKPHSVHMYLGSSGYFVMIYSKTSLALCYLSFRVSFKEKHLKFRDEYDKIVEYRSSAGLNYVIEDYEYGEECPHERSN